jgi:hypothetical protein
MSKRFIFIAAILILAVFLFLGIFYGYPQYQKWQLKKQSQKFLEDYLKPYKEDTYGGKTPEETWGMFLDALKKEDVDLAAKYFEATRQEKTQQWLREVKEKNVLGDMIKDLTASGLDKVKEYGNTSEFIIGPIGQEATAYPIFRKNTVTNIWKISSL